MTPEEAIKHIGVLVRELEPSTKPEHMWATVESIKELVRKAEEERKAKSKSPVT